MNKVCVLESFCYVYMLFSPRVTFGFTKHVRLWLYNSNLISCNGLAEFMDSERPLYGLLVMDNVFHHIVHILLAVVAHKRFTDFYESEVILLK